MKKISIMIAVVIVLLPIASKASTIDVNLSDSPYFPSEVDINRAPANKNVTVIKRENEAETKVTVDGETTDVDGKYHRNFGTALFGATSLVIKIGNETWEGIIGCGNYTSEEQKKPAKKQSMLESLPFDSFGSFAILDGDCYGQIQVINLDTDYAYEFSELLIYSDLDGSYFDTPDFDSPEAIATGRLVSNIIEETLMEKVEVTPMGQAGSLITVPSGILYNSNDYVLLTGMSHKIDGDGNPIGDDVGFSIAIIPEPATILLLGLGGLALLRRRRKA